jgi:hypothetical protein
MKVGIELNNVVRDINSQVLKYYKKDIDKKFDTKSVDVKASSVVEQLPFETKKARQDFMYVDYPYEIYGCAKTIGQNLTVNLKKWEEDAQDNEIFDDGFSVSYFSLMEEGLTIQSTYFFLSKTATRFRKMFMPKDGNEIWDEFDLVITANERIVAHKPLDKKAVLIRTSDNKDADDWADLAYDSLQELIDDERFFDKLFAEDVEVTERKTSLLGRIKNKITKFLQRI